MRSSVGAPPPDTLTSALSATLPPVEGHQVGQHPLVCRILQGMFNQRPLAPCYKTIWSVDTVIEYIQSHLSLADLSLKELAMKLVTLLALSNASRASDLASLTAVFNSSHRKVYGSSSQGLQRQDQVL